jgi:hypothetical protein
MLRSQTIKLLEEKLGGKLHDIEPGNDILDMAPKAKIDNWDYKQLTHAFFPIRN